LETFLEKHPDFQQRTAGEQEKLRTTANWMDLAFYTIQPKNNKTFILNLIPRIVEGRNVKYITGSGQTRATSDRVNIFRLEGNCEKIKRPPRRTKDEILATKLAAMNNQQQTVTVSFLFLLLISFSLIDNSFFFFFCNYNIRKHQRFNHCNQPHREAPVQVICILIIRQCLLPVIRHIILLVKETVFLLIFIHTPNLLFL
jgi:hypothetical protein